MHLQNQRGQTLIAVIVVMVLALSLGVSISSTYINKVRNLANVDSSNRALSVAEAGVEKMLYLPTTTLQDYINNSSCGAECQFSIVGDDGITATAEVTLSFLGMSIDDFPIDLEQSSSYEVNLNGYASNANIQVCWNLPADGSYPSVYASYVYGTVGNYDSDTYAFNSAGSPNSSNGFSTAIGASGYDNCFTVTGKSNPILMRLVPYYSDFTAYIIPAGGNVLPSQGILIESVGRVNDIVKKVTAIKTDSVVPSEADYVIFSKSLTDPLSN